MESHESMIQGLTDRTRNLLRALDRHDRLEDAQEFIGWLDSQIADGKLAEASQEILLRALGSAGDPVNFRILSALDPMEGVDVSGLMAATGLGRVAVSERVNDLVQVGLAVREMISDQVRATALATGLVEWVRTVSGESADQLTEQLSRDIPRQESVTGGPIRG